MDITEELQMEENNSGLLVESLGVLNTNLTVLHVILVEVFLFPGLLLNIHPPTLRNHAGKLKRFFTCNLTHSCQENCCITELSLHLLQLS